VATSAIGGSTGTTSSSGTASTAKKSLDTSDFMNLLITQLKNQDPTQPMSNQELLQQVTQIGTLQSQNSLQDTMKQLVLQNQIASAANLIGKGVVGTDTNANPVSGLVTSVKVDNANSTVNLELDSGQVVPLNNVSTVASLTSNATIPGAPAATNTGG
jgi:flagellar basal-body rod modification protein FlgD